MTVAITGASGHIGCTLTRFLIKQNIPVRALVYNDDQALQDLSIELAKGDVLDLESLYSAFEGVDTVYHLAAEIQLKRRHTEHMQQVNVEGTANVLKACKACGVRRLVHVSSVHAHDMYPLSEIMDETRPLVTDPDALHYDLSKSKAQQLVIDAIKEGFDAVIVNPSGAIGPYDFKPSATGKMLIDFYKGAVPAVVQGGFDWVDVRDVAHGIMLAAEKGRSGESYFLSGEWLSIAELSKLIGEVLQLPTPKFVCPMWLARATAPFAEAFATLFNKEPLYTSEYLEIVRLNPRISHQKAMDELGYSVRPLRQTLEDSYNWLMEAGLLDPNAAMNALPDMNS